MSEEHKHFELIAETGFLGLKLIQPESPKAEEPPRDTELAQESDDGQLQ